MSTQSTVSSRKRIGLIAFGVVCFAVVIGLAIAIPLSKKSQSNLDKAKEILGQVPLIDG